MPILKQFDPRSPDVPFPGLGLIDIATTLKSCGALSYAEQPLGSAQILLNRVRALSRVIGALRQVSGACQARSAKAAAEVAGIPSTSSRA